MRGQLETRTHGQRVVPPLLGLVVACAPIPAPSPHPGVTPEPGTEGAGAALCGSRPGCALAAVHPAGTSPGGVPLQVIELTWPLDEGAGCAPRELWLMSPRAGTAAPRRLRRLCNDGYGAAGVGEDEIRVGPNRFEHRQHGGSAWRWSQASVEQLEPPRLLGSSSVGFWNIGSNCRATDWSWDTFSGTGAWFVPRCDEEDHFAAGAEACTKWPLLPSVPLGEPFRRRGWRRTALGDCALVLGASGAVSGPVAPSGVVLRALALDPRTLVVEMGDGALFPGARLVLTYSDWERPDYGRRCYQSAPPPPRHAEVRWLGRPPRPRARGAVLESVDFAGGMRLLLQLPAAAPRLTLEVFATHGAAAERRLASTSLGPPTTVTLGELWPLPADACAPRDDRLQPRRSDALPPPVGEP